MAVVEGAVFDENVSGICFQRDCVVPIIDGPGAEDEVVGIDCVTAVCVLGADSRDGVVHVDTFEKHVFGPHYIHGPHLTADEADAGKDGVGCVVHTESVRPVWVVGDSGCEFIPNNTVPVEGSVAVTVHCKSVAAENPGGGLVLISCGEAMVEPISRIGAPLLLLFFTAT